MARLDADSFDRAELSASVDAKVNYEHVRMKTIEQLADADAMHDKFYADIATFEAEESANEVNFAVGDKILIGTTLYKVAVGGSQAIAGWTNGLEIDFQAETGLGTLKVLIKNRQDMQFLEDEFNRYLDAQNAYTPE